jgi:hypothetical protein
MADGVGEIAVEGEDRVLHQGIDAEMEPLHGVAAPGDAGKGGVELGEVLHFDHQMPFAYIGGLQAELRAGEAPGGDQPRSRRWPI